MILVVGGIASGKRTYVRSLGFSDDDMADGVLDDHPVVLNAQELVRCAEKAEGDELGGKGPLPDGLVDALAAKQVIACVEVGSGVVPLGRDERAWRERAGRLACELAQRADRVVRMVCGIPTDLKV